MALRIVGLWGLFGAAAFMLDFLLVPKRPPRRAISMGLLAVALGPIMWLIWAYDLLFLWTWRRDG